MDLKNLPKTQQILLVSDVERGDQVQYPVTFISHTWPIPVIRGHVFDRLIAAYPGEVTYFAVDNKQPTITHYILLDALLAYIKDHLLDHRGTSDLIEIHTHRWRHQADTGVAYGVRTSLELTTI